ncbi:MAG: hypothetical protein GY842_02435, partial [bacterium]|nr:hypothetical protein [bacterium]
MFRKPAFWIAFVLVTVACGWFTVAFFDRAFPLVTLELSMDRDAALDAARSLAAARDLGPEGFDQA